MSETASGAPAAPDAETGRAAPALRNAYDGESTRPALEVIRRAYADRKGRLLALGSISLTCGVAEAATMGLLVSSIGTIAAGQATASGHLPIFGTPVSLPVSTLLVMSFVSIVSRAVLQTVEAWVQARIVTSYEADTRRRIFAAFADASWSVQARESLGRIQAVLNEGVSQGRATLKSITEAVVAVANFGMLSLAALVIHPLAVLALAALAMVLFALARPLDRRGKKLGLKKAGLNVDFASSVNEGVMMAQELRVFRATGWIKDLVGAVVGKVRRNRLRSDFLISMVGVIYQGSALLVVAGGVTIAWSLGVSDLARLGVVALLLVRALGYSQTFQTQLHQIMQRAPFLEQLATVEHDYDRPVEKPGRKTLDRIDTLSLDGVGFGYVADRPVLTGIDATISKGQCIGVIGPSGAGKSTLIQLLLRLREPTHGELKVNSEPAEAYSLASWYELMSFVPQEPRLLNASILDNIRFFRPDISEAQVEQAAKAAGIHDEIATLAGGYASTAGERGGALSGGQRQRICIARALVGEPDVLIFDEPTSALDVHSEAKIFEALKALRGKVTLVIIAHRLSTLAICDKLMVIRDGRLQAFGDAATLAQTDAYYAEALKKSQLG